MLYPKENKQRRVLVYGVCLWVIFSSSKYAIEVVIIYLIFRSLIILVPKLWNRRSSWQPVYLCEQSWTQCWVCQLRASLSVICTLYTVYSAALQWADDSDRGRDRWPVAAAHRGPPVSALPPPRGRLLPVAHHPARHRGTHTMRYEYKFTTRYVRLTVLRTRLLSPTRNPLSFADIVVSYCMSHVNWILYECECVLSVLLLHPSGHNATLLRLHRRDLCAQVDRMNCAVLPFSHWSTE